MSLMEKYRGNQEEIDCQWLEMKIPNEYRDYMKNVNAQSMNSIGESFENQERKELSMALN